MPRGLLILPAILLLACCAPTAPESAWNPGSSGAAYPFAPASMRIFPLTRLGRDAAGKPLIICHIEFRDAWGDSAKAVGRLQVSMSGFVIASQDKRQDLPPLTWDIDLADLGRNATLYDRATRTYRVQLVDLPPLLANLPAPTPDAPPAWRIAVRATLSSTADGPPTLEDEYILQP